MAKQAKSTGSKQSQGFEIASPSSSVVEAVVAAFRVILSGKRSIRNAQTRFDDSTVSEFAVVAKEAATYLLGILAQHGSATAEQVKAISDAAKRAFNLSIADRFPDKSRGTVKSSLSQVHRVILSPVTTLLFGQGWRDGKYGSEIPAAKGDGKAKLSLKEGTRRIQTAAKAAQSPQDAVKVWLEKTAKSASDKRAFYKMVAAICENLAAPEAQQQETQEAVA